jgi:hypothetical protein
MVDDSLTPEERTGLQKLMDQVAGVKGDQASWPAAMVLISIFVLVLSVLGIKLALTKRKAAQLASDLRKAQEAQKEAEENAKLAADTAAQQDAQQVIMDSQAKVEAIQSDLDARKIDHDAYVKELQSVTSWDDIVVVDNRGPNVAP